MKQNVRNYLSALALMEWGGLMLYFFFSGRLAAFLHPSFHALVLASGSALILAAGCCLIDNGNGPEHDCAREHDGPLSAKTAVSFCILCVPFALAAWTCPDCFSAAKIRNTGFVEDVRALPGAAAYAKRIASGAGILPSSAPAQAGGEPVKAPDQSMQGYTPDIEDENGRIYSLPLHDKPEEPVENNVIPADSYGGPAAPPAPMTAPDATDRFKPDGAGIYSVTIVDLLWGADDPEIRGKLEGKPLKILGQYLRAPVKDARNPPFELMRLLMVCCAADARPVRVRVETGLLRNPFHPPAEMQWLNVTGSVNYQKTGGKLTPVFVARNIAPAPAPEDPFAY